MNKNILRTLTGILCALALIAPLQASADGKQGGSLTCTTQNNQIWDIEGGYTDADIAPVVSLYQGSSYIQRFNTSANNVVVSSQVSAQTNDQTYTLYNSADNLGTVLTAATCTAKSVPAPAPQPAATSTTSTPAATSSTPAATTTTSSDTKNATNPSPKTSVATKPVPQASGGKHTSVTAVKNIALLTFIPVLIVLLLVSIWVAFRKAGRPGWGSIVPIYSTWLAFEMGGKPGWWAILMLFPFVNLVALAVFALAAIEIAKRFGKSAWFGFFGLFLFGFIGWPILAFGKATYTEPKTDTADGANAPINPVAS